MAEQGHFIYWIRGNAEDGAEVTYVGGVREGVEFPSKSRVRCEGVEFFMLIDMLRDAGYDLVN